MWVKMTAKPVQQRKNNGRRVLLAGVMAYNDRHRTLPCIVRYLSRRGARLVTESSIDPPDTFELIVELKGLEVDCKVVKRTQTEIEVMFLAPATKAEPKRAQVVKAYRPPRKPSLRRKRR